jgi:phage portal protein BeeE
MTPMQAAGVAIEVENLAKVYNRNFLVNDGRPGGLLVVRSEISDEDKDELRSRFQGNLARAGAVGVIASDDGADFVDTAASPRDAAYIQMRTLKQRRDTSSFWCSRVNYW